MTVITQMGGVVRSEIEMLKEKKSKCQYCWLNYEHTEGNFKIFFAPAISMLKLFFTAQEMRPEKTLIPKQV